MSGNDVAVGMYVNKLDEIDRIAGLLADFAEDHGDMDPDEITMRDVSRLTHGLISLRAACEMLGISLEVAS